MAALIRGIVRDSLVGGGRRAGQTLLVQEDAATEGLLRAASVEFLHLSHVPAVVCPASTDSVGAPAPAPVGYVVVATLGPGSDVTSRQLTVTKTCTFRARGTPRGFVESGTWELRSERGRWVVGRTLSREIS